LTQQLLAFSRKQILQPRVLNLNLLVADMNRMLHRLIGEHIEYVADLDPDLKPIVFDPSQAEQIVMNLVINSRDAMADGGRLKIGTRNVEIHEADDDDAEQMKPGAYAMLTVTDTGRGMDSDTLARIFEPFFTTKEQGKGTGLGLSTVFGILQQSGGDIRVTSSPAQGATFSVYFPQDANAKVTTQEAYGEAPALGSLERVLLVEDESAVRRLAVRALEKYGYQVVAVPSPLIALNILKSDSHDEQFDVLLTDIVMPEMRGTTLVERAREFRPDIRVLYMSGYDDEMKTDEVSGEPGNAFLQKPFRVSDLIGKIRGVLGDIDSDE